MKLVDIDSNGNIMGYYDSVMHEGNIPETAFEISEETWQVCIDNSGKYMFNPNTKELLLAPPTPSPTVKDLAKAELITLDSVLPRCVEDLIAVQGIVENTLPQIMQDRLARKRALREQLATL